MLEQADKAKLKKNIQEAVDATVRMNGEKELIDEIAKQVKEQFEIDAGDFKKIVKLQYDQNIEEKREKANAPFEIIDEVFG